MEVNDSFFTAFKTYWEGGDDATLNNCKGAATGGANAAINSPNKLAEALFGLTEETLGANRKKKYEAYVFPVGYEVLYNGVLPMPPVDVSTWWQENNAITNEAALSFVVALRTVLTDNNNRTVLRVVHRCLDSIVYEREQMKLDTANTARLHACIRAASSDPAATTLVFFPPLFPCGKRYETARSKLRTAAKKDETAAAVTYALMNLQVAPDEWVTRQIGSNNEMATRVAILSAKGAQNSFLHWNVKMGISTQVSPVLDAVMWKGAERIGTGSEEVLLRCIDYPVIRDSDNGKQCVLCVGKYFPFNVVYTSKDSLNRELRPYGARTTVTESDVAYLLSEFTLVTDNDKHADWGLVRPKGAQTTRLKFHPDVTLAMKESKGSSAATQEKKSAAVRMMYHLHDNSSMDPIPYSKDVISCLVHICVCYHHRYTGFGPLKEVIQRMLGTTEANKVATRNEAPEWLQNAVGLAVSVRKNSAIYDDDAAAEDGGEEESALPKIFRCTVPPQPDPLLKFMCEYTVQSWRKWLQDDAVPLMYAQGVTCRIAYALGIPNHPSTSHQWFDIRALDNGKHVVLPFRISTPVRGTNTTVFILDLETLQISSTTQPSMALIHALSTDATNCLATMYRGGRKRKRPAAVTPPSTYTDENVKTFMEAQQYEDADADDPSVTSEVKSLLTEWIGKYGSSKVFGEDAHELSRLIMPDNFLPWCIYIIHDLVNNPYGPKFGTQIFELAKALDMGDIIQKAKAAKTLPKTFVDVYPTAVTMRTMTTNELRAFFAIRFPLISHVDRLDNMVEIRRLFTSLIRHQFQIHFRVSTVKVTDTEGNAKSESNNDVVIGPDSGGVAIILAYVATLHTDGVNLTDAYNNALVKLRMQVSKQNGKTLQHGEKL